ncbi:MAG: asparagine synthase (glutamine-hydrolyzing) [Bacteroidota bacterium]
MCGILGQLNRDQAINPEVFTRMRDSMHHRGPDGAGSEFFQDHRVALGHRRLSIIDLTEDGRQPMTNEDGTLWLVFNGEIYNFQGLRTELEALGHTFRSQTDSETLIHGYEAWGLDLLQRIEGIFSFALWDDTKQELLLVRDRVGIKPLYYHYNGKQLYFASELKGIVTDEEVPRKVDWESVADYLMYRFIPQPRTIYQGIQKLPPGHYLRFSLASGDPILAPYWQLEPGESRPTDAEAIEQAQTLLLNSVKEQLVSDVPLGAFLSGGYDSSALVMHMTDLKVPVQSFAIGFNNWSKSEHTFARQVADTFNTQHTEWVLQDEMTSLPEQLAYHYDEPLGGSSFLPTYLVSQKTREHVTVALSGDGGDEVFAGYNWHHRLYEELNPKASFTQKLLGKRNAAPQLDLAERYHAYTSWTKWAFSDLTGVLSPELMRPYANKDNAWVYRQYLDVSQGPIKNFQLLDYQTLMPEVFLTKVDRASMANSLEVRVPFLNTQLIEYTMGMHEAVYYRPKYTKYLLHHQLKGRVPKNILQKPKKGFSAPKKLYLTQELLQNTLGNGYLVKEGILPKASLQSLLDQQANSRLWALYILEFWFKTWKPTA